MCLSNMSTCELLLFANNLALLLSKNLNATETGLLASFLTTVSGQLDIIALNKLD